MQKEKERFQGSTSYNKHDHTKIPGPLTLLRKRLWRRWRKNGWSNGLALPMHDTSFLNQSVANNVEHQGIMLNKNIMGVVTVPFITSKSFPVSRC